MRANSDALQRKGVGAGSPGVMIRYDEDAICSFGGQRAERMRALYWDGTRLQEKQFQRPQNEPDLKLLTKQEFLRPMEGLSIIRQKASAKGKPGSVRRRRCPVFQTKGKCQQA